MQGKAGGEAAALAGVFDGKSRAIAPLVSQALRVDENGWIQVAAALTYLAARRGAVKPP